MGWEEDKGEVDEGLVLEHPREKQTKEGQGAWVNFEVPSRCQKHSFGGGQT